MGALTRREVEVLRLLTEELTYDEVARRLEISVNTVRSHVRVIYRKLDVSTRTAAVLKGMRLGVIA
ncbi:MAG TPA: LuxR C-terminal-related transcriptional regulator [Polyangia bacterium]|jgi:DNA-binding CsgD family transcriptional regulator|nr:LuxR C-terminal-related transcriptional regulator [Polyangia bacterium]